MKLKKLRKRQNNLVALKLPGRIVSIGYSFRKCLIYRFATAVVNHFHLVWPEQPVSTVCFICLIHPRTQSRRRMKNTDTYTPRLLQTGLFHMPYASRRTSHFSSAILFVAPLNWRKEDARECPAKMRCHVYNLYTSRNVLNYITDVNAVFFTWSYYYDF